MATDILGPLLLPLFVWPAGQVGKNCLILREQMDRNAEELNND